MADKLRFGPAGSSQQVEKLHHGVLVIDIIAVDLVDVGVLLHRDFPQIIRLLEHRVAISAVLNPPPLPSAELKLRHGKKKSA